MNSLRISIVQYLNTAPLVRGFTHGPLHGKYALSFTVPSQCAEALRKRDADIAIIPAIEVPRIGNLVVLPGLSIASKNAVRSLLVISRKPIQAVSRLALDNSSRSTQTLTRILCAKRWKIAPEFVERPPDLGEMLREAEAGLVIGDPALRLAFAADRHAVRDVSGALVCNSSSLGIPGDDRLYLYDIVAEWRALTSLPAVLAVWAAYRDSVNQEVAQDFQDALAFGLRQIDQISVEASISMNLPSADLRRYLMDNIHYGLDEQNLKGLKTFYAYAEELGLTPANPTLELLAAPDVNSQAESVAAKRN